MNEGSELITLTRHRHGEYSDMTVRVCKVAGVEHIRGDRGCWVYLTGREEPIWVVEDAGSVLDMIAKAKYLKKTGQEAT